MKNYTRRINRIISIIFLIFIVGCVFSENKRRVSISNLSIGDKLNAWQFDTIKNNNQLDFPYMEVKLKNNKDVICYVIGKQNVIYKIRQRNISDNNNNLRSSISKKLDMQPNHEKDVLLSNIWNSEIYSWEDKLNKDHVALSYCINKNDTLSKDTTWELTIENDSIYDLLQKEYNPNY